MVNDSSARDRDQERTPAPVSTTTWGESKRRLFHGTLHHLIQSLEELRKRLHERIDHIETVALQNTLEPVRDAAGGKSTRERDLERRIVDLENQLRAREGARSGLQKEKEALLGDIEQDRQLLREAWERLEQERVRMSSSPASSATNSSSSVLSSLGLPRSMSPSSMRLSDVPDKLETPAAQQSSAQDVITRSVRRQFEALQRDVRRNS